MKRISLKLISAFIVCFCLFSCNGDNENVEPLYNTVPEIAKCSKGEVSEQEKAKVLKYVNGIRKMYNLPQLEYNKTHDVKAQCVSLTIAAKGELSPVTKDDNCWLDDVQKGWDGGAVSFWGSSDSKWTSSEYHIDDCMLEKGSETVHRRRDILNPFLTHIAFGRVIGTPKKGGYKYVSAAALYVADSKDADLSESGAPEFIAFPHGVFPSKYYDPEMYLNFSVFYDKTNRANNRTIDFSNATVEVFSGTQELTVTDLTHDNNNHGLLNNIQWKIAGLAKNVTYNVNISNVNVAGVNEDYEYSFSFR